MFKMRFVVLLVIGIFGTAAASAQPWQDVDPATVGWSADKLEAIRLHSAALKPAALIIVHNGRVIARWGDTSRKVNVASVRKSLLSALYGIAVAEGRIDLPARLADLGIDDIPPRLTASEKTATVRDLLMARSGIYHPAAH
ncbi:MULTISPECIES: serine hydrolase [unclassified Chelatococcus]|uniref:serine hydrolase n=1 Tax=unclassified Chelatococcus TaxID=2638111 RepID=UPI0020BE801C|nr:MULTISPECIES: serine hydrolase [unclassified Chelatococcus]MCO5078431.1 serine hydrolase [Chelatococcus sp.]CAH1655065.1 exported hypothetical protein [Hyphomicrobiales bacterium]CAH1685206.1 exported hypothetical protein [Hyphomicrobiales bacterium]